MSLSDHLLAWRRHRRLTQTSLAQKAGIPQPSIASLEAGRTDPKLSSLRRLAVALDVSVGTLLDSRPPKSAWSRHRIDALVRRAAGRSKSNQPIQDPWARRLRVVLADRLAAAGRPVATRGRTGIRLEKQLRAELGPEVWETVVNRLDKLI